MDAMACWTAIPNPMIANVAKAATAKSALKSLGPQQREKQVAEQAAGDEGGE
jgi:hypothetical protein